INLPQRTQSDFSVLRDLCVLCGKNSSAEKIFEPKKVFLFTVGRFDGETRSARVSNLQTVLHHEPCTTGGIIGIFCRYLSRFKTKSLSSGAQVFIKSPLRLGFKKELRQHGCPLKCKARRPAIGGESLTASEFVSVLNRLNQLA